ncbi:hypothetical protein JCM10212_005877 [Sporobolomyces blumeae]
MASKMGPPAAPAKSRPLPTRTRTTRSTAPSTGTTSPTAAPSVDRLATDLTQLSLATASTKTNQRLEPKLATRRVPPPAARPLAKSSTANRSDSTAKTIPTPRSKPVPVARSRTQAPPELQLSIGERAKQASTTINAALATLATLAKSGFTVNASHGTPSCASTAPSRPSSNARSESAGSRSANPSTDDARSREKAEAAADEAGRAFAVLRKLGRENVPLGNKRTSVERTAGKLVADLVQVGLYRHALCELSAIRASILSWYGPSTPEGSTQQPIVASNSLLSFASDLLIPLPPASFLDPPTLSETLSTSPSRPTLEELVPLALAVQQHLFYALFRSPSLLSPDGQRQRVEKLHKILIQDGKDQAGGPLDWNRFWQAKSTALEPASEKASIDKRVDGIMLSMFQTVTQGTSAAEGTAAPELLLELRTQALLCYSAVSSFARSGLSSSTLSNPPQLPAFHAQHRKILLRFGRSAQTLPQAYPPEVIARHARKTFETLMDVLARKSLTARSSSSRGATGTESEKDWRELCEVVLHLAKKGQDVELLELVSKYLDEAEATGPSSTSPVVGSLSAATTGTPREIPMIAPGTQVSNLVTSLLRLLALFDLFTKSLAAPKPLSPDSTEVRSLIDCLRRCPTHFERAGRLRTLARDGDDATLKDAIPQLDKTVHQARHVFARYLRTPLPSSAVEAALLRPDQLITLPGATKPVPDDPVCAEIHKLVRTSLDAFAESVGRSHPSDVSDPAWLKRRPSDGAFRTSAIDTLVLLAQDALVISDRPTHAVSHAYLSRALPLLRALPGTSSPVDAAPELDLDLDEMYYSIHSVASTLYNIGGRLYSAEMPDAAVRFVEQSCRLTRDALEAFERRDARVEEDLGEGLKELKIEDGPSELDEGTERNRAHAKRKDEIDEVKKDLQKVRSRRWELLAMAQHAVGDRQAAHAAYIAATLSQAPIIVSSLSSDAASHPLSTIAETYAPLFKLVQRATRLATFDLLLAPEQVSLASHFGTESAVPRDVQGILLELQLFALDQTLDHPSSRLAASAVLGSLERTYRAEDFPMRRARILLRSLQQLCMGGDIVDDLRPAAIAAEIDELCSTSKCGRDVSLRCFAAQYIALSHLYLGFHAHSGSTPSTSTSSVVELEARQALSIFRKAFGDDLPPSPSAVASTTTAKVTFQTSPARSPDGPVKQAVQAPTTTRRRTTRAAATPAKSTAVQKTPQTRRTLAAARRAPTREEQVTPPKKGVFDPVRETKVTPAKAGDNVRVGIDGSEKTYALFETMANLLGALGFSLLRLAYLKFLRRLSAKLPRDGDQAFVATSAHLAHAYVVLGKTARAGLVLAQADQRIQAAANGGAPVPPATEVAYHLEYAEYLAMLGNHDRAARAYDKAMTLAEQITQPEQSVSTTARIVEMSTLMQRVASASSVCSIMLQRKGDLARSLAPALQAMRLASRALNNIARLDPVTRPAHDSVQAFRAAPTDNRTPLSDLAAPARKKNNTPSDPSRAGLSWLLADQLAMAILRVSQIYLVRGTPKHAEFYASQAVDLAQDLGSPRLEARACAMRAEVRLLAGKLADADQDLLRMEALLGSSTCPEAVDARRLRADLQMRQQLQLEAFALYVDAQKTLDSFVRNADDAEVSQTPIKRSLSAKHLSPNQSRSAIKAHSPAAAFSPSPSRRAGDPTDWILPTAHAYIVRMQVALLRLQNRPDESASLLKRLSALATLEEDKADELRLLATIQLQDMLARCTSDPVWGMLPESVLSIPAMSSSVATTVRIGTPRAGPTLLSSLKDIESLLVRATAHSTSRSQPNKLRELSLLQGTIRSFHANVGKPGKRTAASVAHVLDLGLAVTLRRDMLDALDHKLADAGRHDDLLWPLLDFGAAEQEAAGAVEARQILLTMRDRYRLENPEPTLVESPISTILPPKCSTVSIHLTPEADSLILVRQRRDCEPVVFKLPLDRLARREGEDESFTFDIAQAELEEIIALSNASSQNAKHVDSREARASWWQERQELDDRLRDLLQTIEDAWLGAFKCVFYDARYHPSAAFAAFKARIERILKRSIVRAAQDKKATRFKLDDAIVECVAALPASSREEDLEDLFFFMTEAFQFSGVPLACDETDVDQVVVDLREALEELHGTKSAPKGTPDPDEHTFLILDKALRSFPWESLPCLLGRSVSRLPSLSFLRDRLDLASSLTEGDPTTYEITVDPRRSAFVLNPGGDLKNTQSTFEPWLSERSKNAKWSGIVGRAPQEEEMRSALASKDLFLYFGHGGAEQYVRTQTVRNLPRCAVTMLWGCSSGYLKDQGDFDPVGTPYNYMVAGSPALVANLWDVTDKDIDKFAQSVFELTKIATRTASSSSEVTSEASAPSLTLTSAVAKSRAVCNLRYLNGAAPVVYGVPVRFLASPAA